MRAAEHWPVRLALLLGALLAARAPSAWGADVVVSSAEARLVLASDGRVRSLVHVPSGRELLRRGDVPLVAIRAHGRTLPVTAVEQRGEKLTLGFGDPGYGAVLRIAPAGRDLVVRVDELRGDGVEAVEFVRLAPAVDQEIGSTLAVRSDDDVSLSLVGARDNVETVANRAGLMSATVYAEPGLDGAAAAIVVAASTQFAARMADVEGTLGLPSPRLGGAWAKASEAARRSYLFVDLTEANAGEVIRWAQLGGFDTVLVYVRSWAESAGSYRVNRASFPGGEDGLAATVRRLHDAGLRVGMHMLTSLVAKRDPLAAPRPDRRLLKDATARLVQPLSSGATEVVLAGDARGFARPGEPGGTDVQIGDEVLRYSSVAPGPRPSTLQLGGCTRGVNGTVATAHQIGDEVRHLVERHGSYLADLRSTLAADIAERIADLVDRVGFDMIYLDAGEVNDANGPFWYWGGRQQQEILQRIRRPIVVQGSGTTAWTWHWFTRGTCDDGVAVGRDAWLEVHKVGRALPAYRRNRLPAELGWWPLYERAPGRRATTADEAWRLGAYALALDVPLSVETTVASLAGNPDSEDILRTLARFEEARLGGGPPPPPVAGRALPGAALVQPVELLGGDEGVPVDVPSRDPSADGAGALALRIPLADRASSPRRWLAALGGPPAGVDLSHHEGLAVTLDVAGPTQDRGLPAPVLNVQLETAGRRYRDYLVDLDFRGERTVVVQVPSADRVIRELPPVAAAYPLKAALMDADLTRTVAVNLRWMRGGGVRVRVRRIEAMNAA